MKKIITLIILSFFATTVNAQAPQKMSYQAVIRNASNTLISNSNVRMRISVLQGTATGTAVYVETQTAVTNANGLVTVEIGAGTAVTGTFASIAWGTNAYFIKTETDPTGGTNYSITGTSQFLSVPYALFASSGNAGPAGPTGATGPAGPQGPIGLTGAAGAQGPRGLTGTAGSNGAVGAAGPQGPTGAQGPIGLTGAQGVQGIPGAATLSGTVNKMVKFGTATTGVDSQISDDGTYVKIKPNGFTGFDENLSRLQIAGSDDALRLIGSGATYGEGGKLNFGDADLVYLSEDEDDSLLINSSGRTAIMGGLVGIGTLTPGVRLDVNGYTKTLGIQLTNGAGAGKILTSDANGYATWETPATVPTPPVANESYQKFASDLVTTIQGAEVDFPTTNVTVPVTGTYLITYYLDAYNTFSLTCVAPCTSTRLAQTKAYLDNKNDNHRLQNQQIDFLLEDSYQNSGNFTQNYSMPAHQISGSVVSYLTANDQVGFKMRSFVGANSGAPAGGEIRIRSSNVTLVRLF